MYLKQIYTGCLSEAAYFVESNGEAIIIDPLMLKQMSLLWIYLMMIIL
jgi:hypothetical protein